MSAAGVPQTCSAHAGVVAGPPARPSTRRRSASKPLACAAMNGSSVRPSSTSTCSTASISALSVPGRTGSHCVPSCFAVSVRRGSMTMTGTPRCFAWRSRARHSQPMMQSIMFAPHSTISSECCRVAGSTPGASLPSITGCTYSAAAEL